MNTTTHNQEVPMTTTTRFAVFAPVSAYPGQITGFVVWDREEQRPVTTYPFRDQERAETYASGLNNGVPLVGEA